MKRLFLTFVLLIGAIHLSAQDVVDRCFSELEPLMTKARAVWHDGNSYYGITSERAERYTIYCLEACAVIDKYVDHINDVNEQLDLLWGQVDILSDILKTYEENKMGLSPSEYAQQSNRKVLTLQKLAILCKKITYKADRDSELYNVNEALAQHYFSKGNFKDAATYYSMCISNYNELLLSEYANDSDTRKAGQKAYYWMGYTAYKQGDTILANKYFNKAKSILNDSLIQPYQ